MKMWLNIWKLTLLETMSLDPKKKQLKTQELESMRRAVEEGGITQIHPDKMEEWAEYLVRKLKK
jgi:hypothetical protein